MKSTAAIGLILAGGRGQRLSSIAPPYSKTLLKVNKMPVIAYGARAMAPFVEEIVVVTSPMNSGKIVAAVRDAIRHTSKAVIEAVQSKPLGVAHAIDVGLAETSDDRALVVLCGDNILQGTSIGVTLQCAQDVESRINLAWTYKEFDPLAARRFAVWSPLPSGKGMLIEKPAHPPSRICWCGVLAFRSSHDVRRRIAGMSPSGRGEYEVTDLLNTYLLAGEGRSFPLEGYWFDIGTPEALKEAQTYMAHHARSENESYLEQ